MIFKKLNELNNFIILKKKKNKIEEVKKKLIYMIQALLQY
jgi:hypothetical protein